MRRFVLCLILAGFATPALAPLSPGALAQGAAPSPAPSSSPSPSPGAGASEPHGWLYGSWTGGLFPVPSGMTAQMCLAQPVVIFTRDLVLRATLIDQVYHQRAIETVRAEPGVTDFHFAPGVDPLAESGSTLMGAAPPPPEIGFGCADPDSLHVVRRSDNAIMFEGCRDFPEPLIRCPSR